MHAVILSIGASLAIVAFVGMGYAGVVGLVALLEPLTRRGRLWGYVTQGALQAVVPFVALGLATVLLHELPDGGRLHARALPALAALGALTGALRWWVEVRRGDG